MVKHKLYCKTDIKCKKCGNMLRDITALKMGPYWKCEKCDMYLDKDMKKWSPKK